MMKELAVTLAISWTTECQVGSTSDLQHPPRAAAVERMHGDYIWIYPDGILNKLSGCHAVWTDSRNKWM